jgi:inosose dehydratase
MPVEHRSQSRIRLEVRSVPLYDGRMKYGVADYGINAWSGGMYDYEDRLLRLKEIGYEGTERISATTEAEALAKSALVRKLGMGYATVRGPSDELSIQWAAAFGCDYVWVASKPTGYDFDIFCRQANIYAEACVRWGLKAALHNHMGTCVETHEEVERFLEACSTCNLILDTAHLAAVGGDPESIIRRYPERIQVMHMKDWYQTNPSAEKWFNRGRFCELDAGNIGMNHAGIMRALKESGFDGWMFVEQDTHLQDPFKDLATSRKILSDLDSQ